MEFLTIETLDWIFVVAAGALFIWGQSWCEFVILVAAVANLFVK